MGGRMVELAVTIDDQNDTNKPANEGGTRDDMRDPPLKFTRNVVYHAHQFSSTGNTADQSVELRHINNSDASGGAYVGEVLKLVKGPISPADQDTCNVPYCTFPINGAVGVATEDLPRHTTVGYGESGGGTFGKLDADGETFMPLSANDVANITHYRVNPNLTGGFIQVWAKVDDAAVAIDPYTSMDVATVDDPVADGTPVTVLVTVCNTASAMHRQLSGDDACGCPKCGQPGNSTIDPRTGAVAFDVPASGYAFRGVDLGLAFSYNSDAKADPRFDSPNLPGVDPAGDLARMSQRNSRWTHNWAQAIEVVSDGVLQRAIWHTGGGGTVGFERTSEGLWIGGDSDHRLVSGGTTLTNIRVYGNHSSGGEQVEDERLVQTVLPYSWFELQSGDGTVHRFETPIWQKGTGAAVAYFPLQRTRDRWGRGVDLLWQNGNLASVTENQSASAAKHLTFFYAGGLLRSVEDALGRTHTLQYQGFVDEGLSVSRQKLTGITVTGPGSPSVTYSWQFGYGSVADPTAYGGSYTGDLVVSKTEPTGKVAFYQYGPVNPNRDTHADWDGALAQSWYVDNGVSYVIQRTGTTLTYPGNVAFAYGYGGVSGGHGADHDLTSIEEIGTNRATYFGYDPLHHLEDVWTSLEYNGNNSAPLVHHEVLPNPDQSVQKITTTDILGAVTVTNFQAFALPTSQIRYAGGTTPQPYDQSTAWFYNGQAVNLTKTQEYLRPIGTLDWTEIDGSSTDFTYDPSPDAWSKDRPVTSTELGARVWTVAYDTAGRPHTVTSPPNLVPAPTPGGSPDAVPSEETLEYHADGLPSKVTDALGREVEMTYAQVNQPSHLRVSIKRLWDNGERQMVLDAAGRVIESRDERSVPTYYTYDQAGRLIQVTEVPLSGAERTTQYRYNLRGELTEMVPPKGELCKVQYFYERYSEYGVATGVQEGRLTRIVHPDGSEEYFGYNDAGELVWESRPNGVGPQWLITRHYRDALHRVERTEYPDAPGQLGSAFTVTTEYDEFGRVKTASRNGVATSYEYDGLDRVVKIAPLDGRKTMTIGYLADEIKGRWITQTSLSGVAGTWDEYEDTKGRFAGVNSPYGQKFWMEYDKSGRTVGRWYSQTAGGTPWKDATFSYNDAARTSLFTYWKPNGARITELLNEYDVAGRLTRETDGADNQHRYYYDDFNQLTLETHPDLPTGGISYQYDLNGNRRKVTQGSAVDWYGVDAADKLLWINRTNDAEPSSTQNAPFTKYAYDDFGNQVWRQRRATQGGTRRTYDFSWDADGRLLEAKEGGAGVFNATYAVDGERITKSDIISGDHIYSYGLHDTNGGGTLHTPGFGHKEGTKTRKYQQDQLGSTRSLSDGPGDTATSVFRYDAYGQRTFLGGTSSDTFPTEYQFAGAHGYQSEPTSGDGLDLQYLYQRYYDPQAGRFITRDPIRWAGGNNLFAYGGNDPVNTADPSGMDFVVGSSDRPLFVFTSSGVRDGLETGLAATGSAVSFGAYDGGRYKHELGFREARACAEVGRDVAILAAGGGLGSRMSGVRATGKEFSHWIPDRMLKRASRWLADRGSSNAGKSLVNKFGRSNYNGNYVTRVQHYRHDPYRQLTRAEMARIPRLHPVLQQMDRVPRLYYGLGLGGADVAIGRARQKR